jgi:DNA invertase Pin-like site-specific DNA recombinase
MGGFILRSIPPPEGVLTMRVAIYARYSSDNQRAASIEDQFRICRDRAGREGWEVVGTYKDAGISGASMILRPGIQTLLQDAKAGCVFR